MRARGRAVRSSGIVDAAKVAHFGLSEAGVEVIRRARYAKYAGADYAGYPSRAELAAPPAAWRMKSLQAAQTDCGPGR